MSRGDWLLLAALLAAFGIADSAYLTWQWYEVATAGWCDLDPYWSCARVRESPWSSLAGVPLSLIAVGGFGAVLLVVVLGLRGHVRLGPIAADTWLLALAGLGAALGTGLTYIEVFVIQAICILCVTGFALDVGILGTAVILLRGTRMADGCNNESPRPLP